MDVSVPVDQVVSANIDDVANIQKLLNHYAAMGDLLPRTKSDIEANLEHFRVIKRAGIVVRSLCLSYTHLLARLSLEKQKLLRFFTANPSNSAY